MLIKLLYIDKITLILHSLSALYFKILRSDGLFYITVLGGAFRIFMGSYLSAKDTAHMMALVSCVPIDQKVVRAPLA